MSDTFFQREFFPPEYWNEYWGPKRATVSAELDVSWRIEAVAQVSPPISPVFGDLHVRPPAPITVAATFRAEWQVREPVMSVLDQSWQVRAVLSKDFNVLWQAREATAEALRLSYRVMAPVAAEARTAWLVRGLAARAIDQRVVSRTERNLRILMDDMDEDAMLVRESWLRRAA